MEVIRINKKHALIAFVSVTLFLGISVAFFFAAGGMDEFVFDDYISVYLTIDTPRVRIDVDREIQAASFTYLDRYGQMLLDGINFVGIEMSAAIFSLVNRAVDMGIVQNYAGVTTNISPPRNVEDAWLVLVEYGLFSLHNVLDEWLIMRLE